MDRKCNVYSVNAPLLNSKDLERHLQAIEGWKLVQEHHIEKEYHFKNFKEALDFVNEVGKIAESQGHHPCIYVGWGIVMLALWTHKIDGLTENDFILAALCDKAHQLRFKNVISAYTGDS